MKQTLIDRLTTYAKIDTQSNAESTTCPSTEGQWDLLRLLEKELQSMGLTEITLDDNGYLFASLPANTDESIPTIGFLAHVDTATDYTGKDVNPQIVESYDGNDLVLNDSTIMRVSDFPELKNYIGHTLMTTDGTTLLGADNKAGIAIILTAMDYFLQHPEIKHGKIRVGFTPDEEIGRGPHKFDVQAFGADYAYTMDGGPLGELQYESFNAAGARVTTHGVSVHPGSAKDKMVNAITMALKFQSHMPPHEVPEKTDGYDGFVHLMDIHGKVEKTVMDYIIRDFDKAKFEEKKQRFYDAADAIRKEYGDQAIELDLKDQYYNMGEKITPVMEIVDQVQKIMEDLAIKPLIIPIRGGTDGSQLSYMGMPTPNIFTGGENYHGKFEYVSIQNMEKATEVVKEIIKRAAQN